MISGGAQTPPITLATNGQFKVGVLLVATILNTTKLTWSKILTLDEQGRLNGYVRERWTELLGRDPVEVVRECVQRANFIRFWIWPIVGLLVLSFLLGGASGLSLLVKSIPARADILLVTIFGWTTFFGTLLCVAWMVRQGHFPSQSLELEADEFTDKLGMFARWSGFFPGVIGTFNKDQFTNLAIIILRDAAVQVLQCQEQGREDGIPALHSQEGINLAEEFDTKLRWFANLNLVSLDKRPHYDRAREKISRMK